MADFNPRRNLEDYLAENPFEETSNEDNAGDAPGQPLSLIHISEPTRPY